MLYPLKFHPILKKKIWGGERLAYKSKEHEESIGESWEISAVEDNISVVSNGILADNDLQELIEVYMGDLVGDHIYEKFGIEFNESDLDPSKIIRVKDLVELVEKTI